MRLIGLAGLLLALFTAGCCGVPGNGTITERHYGGDVENGVTRLLVGGAWRVTIDPNAGNNESVVVIDENLQDLILVEAGNGTLDIRTLPNTTIRPTRTPELRLALTKMPEQLNFSGSCEIRLEGAVCTPAQWSFSGSSSAVIPVREAPELAIRSSGSSSVTVEGDVGRLTLASSGSSRTTAGNCKSVKLLLSGSGFVELGVTEQLQVRASGSSRIRYSGSPVLDVRTSGSSSVVKQ